MGEVFTRYGTRTVYKFRWGGAEGFEVELVLTHDGLLQSAEVRWFKPGPTGFGPSSAIGRIECDYRLEPPFSDLCFDTALDVAEFLIGGYHDVVVERMRRVDGVPRGAGDC